MAESFIAIGCDSSKGRIDVEIRTHHGTVLHTGIFDDVPDDHAAMRRLVDDLHARHPEAEFLVGIESTGGLERNWLAFFRHEKRWATHLRAFKLNALAVHAYREAKLHRAPGDAAAASDIACFLLERCRACTPQREAEDGPIVFYRTIRSLTGELIATSQRLQALLVAAHPDLVRFCRFGIPGWVRALLERYPTAACLARAKVATVDAIPHIDAERAAELVAHAKVSVASMTDPATAAAIRLLVTRLRDTQDRIDQGQADLLKLITADPRSPLATAVALLDGIPGISPWSAACLACEIGDPTRFAHPKAIIAWAGLDPRSSASGDVQHDHGISHRGNAHIRAILFPLAMAGVLHNPVLAAFHQRLVARGKCRLESLVAVMAKLLRIAHAVLLTGKPFTLDHEAARRARAQAAEAERSTTAPVPPPQPAAPRLDAPISRREAKRRKAAAPGAEVRDQSPKRDSRRGPHPELLTPVIPAKG